MNTINMIAFACMSLYIISWLVDIIRSDWLEGTVLKKPVNALAAAGIILLYNDPQRRFEEAAAQEPRIYTIVACVFILSRCALWYFEDRRQP